MSDRHDKKRATMAANLEAQTGRTLAEWAAIASEAPRFWCGYRGTYTRSGIRPVAHGGAPWSPT
jgi:hypothetical protein